MQEGRVTFWSSDRKFGFIRPDSGADVFVHLLAFEEAGLPPPAVGDRLLFNIEDGRNGKPQATNLRRADVTGVGAGTLPRVTAVRFGE